MAAAAFTSDSSYSQHHARRRRSALSIDCTSMLSSVQCLGGTVSIKVVNEVETSRSQIGGSCVVLGKTDLCCGKVNSIGFPTWCRATRVNGRSGIEQVMPHARAFQQIRASAGASGLLQCANTAVQTWGIPTALQACRGLTTVKRVCNRQRFATCKKHNM